MKVKAVIGFILTTIFLVFSAFKEKESKDFPKPEGIENLLFYVQRTINANTIVYELNLSNGELNENEPIKSYWINYANKSETERLTYIQKKFAYGIKTKLIDKEKKIYSFHFVSYDKRELYLIKSKTDNKYKVFVYVDKQLVLLKNIHVQIEGGTFWIPNVKYVLLRAVKPDNNEEITEKIIP